MKQFQHFEDFMRVYSDDHACMQLLFDFRWANGFSCTRCGHTTAVKGRTRFYKRCQDCHYDESCTANTPFHKLKFPISKAFAIIYQISTIKKGMSSAELARQHGIHQQTAWFFRKKIQKAMQCIDDPNHPVVKELLRNKKATNAKKKPKITAARIDHPKENKRASRLVVNMISEIRNRYIQLKPGKKKEAPLTNKSEIYQIKRWLKGIHHHISIAHMADYIQEFYFRYKRRKQLKKNPMNIILMFTKMCWMPYKQGFAN